MAYRLAQNTVAEAVLGIFLRFSEQITPLKSVILLRNFSLPTFLLSGVLYKPGILKVVCESQ